jgi:hypothetical protein
VDSQGFAIAVLIVAASGVLLVNIFRNTRQPPKLSTVTVYGEDGQHLTYGRVAISRLEHSGALLLLAADREVIAIYAPGAWRRTTEVEQARG